MSVTEEKFSEKFEAAAKSPKNRGAFYQEEATEKGMALVEAKFKDMKLYWLVDTEEDRVYNCARGTLDGGRRTSIPAR